jgi:hypothetical protein
MLEDDNNPPKEECKNGTNEVSNMQIIRKKSM